MAELSNGKFEWAEDLTSEQYDYYLSNQHGHPLQSAKWGDSKKLSDHINDHRWIAFKDGSPILIARFEERYIFKFWKVAWCPKGPLVIDQLNETIIYKEFLNRLKKRGFFLCATNPWKEIKFTKNARSAFYTIWIDLTLGKETLLKNLNKKCRNDIKRAKKLGVVIERTRSTEDIQSFYDICISISQSKGFNLCTTIQMMSHLLSDLDHDYIEPTLFVARQEGKLCGGAFVIRCGESVHYIWGAVSREFAHFCVGEALQWEIIEWSLSKQCKKYDLEGISEKQNSGVDKFKKKLGGTVIAYSNIKLYPLGLIYKLMLPLIKVYLLLQPKINRVKLVFSFDKFSFSHIRIWHKYISK